MALTFINIAAAVVILWVAGGHLGAATREVPFRFRLAWLLQVVGALCAIAVLLHQVHAVPLWVCNSLALTGLACQLMFDRRGLRPIMAPVVRRRNTDAGHDHAHRI